MTLVKYLNGNHKNLVLTLILLKNIKDNVVYCIEILHQDTSSPLTIWDKGELGDNYTQSFITSKLFKGAFEKMDIISLLKNKNIYEPTILKNIEPPLTIIVSNSLIKHHVVRLVQKELNFNVIKFSWTMKDMPPIIKDVLRCINAQTPKSRFNISVINAKKLVYKNIKRLSEKARTKSKTRL